RPPYRATKQDIADLREACLAMIVDDAAWRMSGTMEDLEAMFAKGNGFAFLQIAVGNRIAHLAGKADLQRLVFDIGHDGRIELVRADDLDLQCFFQLHRPADMIDVTMRDPDSPDGDPVLAQNFKDTRHLAARVDHDTGARVFIEQQGAILLEGRDRDNPGAELSHALPTR